jgi:hypothetical protein
MLKESVTQALSRRIKENKMRPEPIYRPPTKEDARMIARKIQKNKMKNGLW